MPLIEIDPHPAARQLRWFGVLLAGFVLLAGGVLRWRFDAPAAALMVWTGGGALAAVYAAVRPLRRWIFLGWLYAAFPIGWVVSHVVLAASYYLVVTPIGLLVRWVRGDPLDRRPSGSETTYWRERRRQKDVRRYFRQF